MNDTTFYRLHELAHVLDVNPMTLRRRGVAAIGIRVGKRAIRYRLKDVLEFLNQK